MLGSRDRWLPLLAGRLQAASALDAMQLERVRQHLDEDLQILVSRVLIRARDVLGLERVAALSRLAQKHGIYVASGVTEWDPARKKIFNTGVMFGRKGEVACHYHKQFLATHDQNWFAFGERGCPVVDTDLGRIGLLICFDGRIPEIFRAMAMQGADVIVDMANFFAMGMLCNLSTALSLDEIDEPWARALGDKH